MRRPLRPAARAPRASTPRTSATEAETAESSSNSAPVVAATIRASVVFPLPAARRRWTSGRGRSRSRAAAPSSFAEHVPLADELVQRARAQPRQRAARAPARVPAASEKRSPMREVCSAVAVEDSEVEASYDEPILPGDAPSDYERYLRTDELLALQKRPEERAHHDELLFQTVHQSSELWLKLAAEEVETAGGAPPRARARTRAPAPAARASLPSVRHRRSSTCSSRCRRGSTRRSGACSATAAASTRPAGARSASWRRCSSRSCTPSCASAGSTSSRCTRGREHEELYQLAEALIELGRARDDVAHPPLQGRRAVIGDKVVGTQGTPVEVLGRLIHKSLYPELWEVRNKLTALAKESD